MTDTLPIPLTSPLTPSQQTTLINLIRRAAKAEILPRFRASAIGTIAMKTGRHDLVTEADAAAEAMLARGIQRLFPHALVLGEEQVGQNPKLIKGIAEAEIGFIIDPIDGTWNFAHQLGAFGTIVAVTRFGKPVLGILYDPLADDWIIADEAIPTRRGTPLTTGYPVHVGKGLSLSDMTGSVHIYTLPEDMRSDIFSCLSDIGRIQIIRSSCHEYRMLAQGQLDFVLSGLPNAWDHAAGVLACQQAGGVSAMLDGRDYNAGIQDGFVLSASTQEGWQQLCEHFAFLIGSTTRACCTELDSVNTL